MNKTLALLFLLLFCCSDFLVAQPAWHFEGDVRNYAYQAIDHPPVPGCTLFVGSSSFALWKTLEETFADYEAVNRGFGGSQFPDNLRAIERIHLPAAPSRIVIFCGTNDIAGGADAETVFNNFKFYIARIWNELPATEIYFVVPTHAPVREKHWKTGDELFAKVQALAEKVSGLYCIDIRPGMLGEDGKVREDLFVKDRLHLNPDGYAIWEKVFKATFDATAKDRKAPNLAELYQSRKSAGLFDDPRFAEQGIAIKDYSQPTKLMNLLFIGKLVVAESKSTTMECAAYLQRSGHEVNMLDHQLPENKETDIIFSIMHDADVRTTPTEYRTNLKSTIESLWTDYPQSKFVIHCPPNIDPFRSRACLAEIEALVDYYASTSAAGRVLLGDTGAYRLPMAKQTEVLGRFWGAAILKAVK